MSFIVIIPARYASTRLPGKPLLDIDGKPLLVHVVDRANASDASQVVVATDDQRIADQLESRGIAYCMTRADHQSGSDRLAEVVAQLNLDDEQIVINVQGDEPMIPPQLINSVAISLQQSTEAVMATAAHPLAEQADIDNPNVVKVVTDRHNYALYFSRSTIPYAQDCRVGNVYKHIGIYAYRASFLRRYHQLPVSDLEQSEKLEQLRVLDNGDKIVVAKVDYDVGIGVDTAEDLDKLRSFFDPKNLS